MPSEQEELSFSEAVKHLRLFGSVSKAYALILPVLVKAEQADKLLPEINAKITRAEQRLVDLDDKYRENLQRWEEHVLKAQQEYDGRQEDVNKKMQLAEQRVVEAEEHAEHRRAELAQFLVQKNKEIVETEQKIQLARAELARVQEAMRSLKTKLDVPVDV